MDIYQRLFEDHQLQRDLAEQITATVGDSEQRQELWRQFLAEATAHANAEEQIFYAPLLEHPEIQEQARHSIAEHKDADEIIQELDSMDMSSSGWLQKFNKLVEELEHHMKEEEDDVFEQAQNLIDASEATAMSRDFDERKQRELEEIV